jgi:hypothetical protein
LQAVSSQPSAFCFWLIGSSGCAKENIVCGRSLGRG